MHLVIAVFQKLGYDVVRIKKMSGRGTKMEKKQKKVISEQLTNGGCKPEKSNGRQHWEVFLKEQSKSLWSSGIKVN